MGRPETSRRLTASRPFLVGKVREGGNEGVCEASEHEAYPRSCLFVNERPCFKLGGGDKKGEVRDEVGDERWLVFLGVLEGEIEHGEEIRPKGDCVCASSEPTTGKGATVPVSG